jgi:hypothetical protein
MKRRKIMKIYNITPIKFNITNNKIEQSKNKKEDINNNILLNLQNIFCG